MKCEACDGKGAVPVPVCCGQLVFDPYTLSGQMCCGQPDTDMGMCDACGGWGDTDRKTCTNCKGNGCHTYADAPDGSPWTEKCNLCDGKGYVVTPTVECKP